MWKDDERERFGIEARRHRQIGGNLVSVWRLVARRLQCAERHVRQRRISLADDVGGSLHEIDQVVDGRAGCRLDFRNNALVVGGSVEY